MSRRSANKRGRHKIHKHHESGGRGEDLKEFRDTSWRPFQMQGKKRAGFDKRPKTETGRHVVGKTGGPFKQLIKNNSEEEQGGPK